MRGCRASRGYTGLLLARELDLSDKSKVLQGFFGSGGGLGPADVRLTRDRLNRKGSRRRNPDWPGRPRRWCMRRTGPSLNHWARDTHLQTPGWAKRGLTSFEPSMVERVGIKR